MIKNSDHDHWLEKHAFVYDKNGLFIGEIYQICRKWHCFINSASVDHYNYRTKSREYPRSCFPCKNRRHAIAKLVAMSGKWRIDSRVETIDKNCGLSIEVNVLQK